MPAERADEDKKSKKKKKKDGDGGGGSNDGVVQESGSNVRSNYGVGEIRLGGYVFGRADLQWLERTTVDSMGVPGTRDLNAIDLSVPSARFRVDYQAPWEWLNGQIEVEFAGKPDMRDGYVQAKGKNVAFRMGQSKMPVLAMQMESPWVLPLVRRGLIHDLTVDWLDVAGRLPGAMLTVREKFGDIKPRLFLGAFQARRFTEIDADGSATPTWSGSFRSRPEARGARSGRRRQRGDRRGVRAPDRLTGVQPAPASVDRGRRCDGQPRVRDRWPRIWVDGLAGASWYELASKPIDDKDATFVAVRALVAYRFGGVVPAAPYIEPYLFGGVFDPDVEIASDLAWEATAGVNFGFYGRARATLQAEMDRGQRNFPTSYLGGISRIACADRAGGIGLLTETKLERAPAREY